MLQKKTNSNFDLNDGNDTLSMKGKLAFSNAGKIILERRVVSDIIIPPQATRAERMSKIIAEDCGSNEKTEILGGKYEFQTKSYYDYLCCLNYSNVPFPALCS